MMSSLVFSEFIKEILSVDVIFWMLLIWLETQLQNVFFCPCISSCFFSVSLCVCSSITIMFTALLIQMHKYKEELQKHNWRVWTTWQDNWTTLIGVVLPLLISLFTWLTLWFYRGNYYVCQATTWNGTWTVKSSGEPYKWCEPSPYNSTIESLSVDLFNTSVVKSMILLIVLTVLIMFYIIALVFGSFKSHQQNGEYTVVAHGDPELSSD